MPYWHRKYPDSPILLNYDDDAFIQGHRQIKGAFKACKKDDILQPCMSDKDLRSSIIITKLVINYKFSISISEKPRFSSTN